MGADWKAARLIAPVEDYSSAEWREHWHEHPETFLQVLGDIYRIYKSEEAKRLGTANPRGGRRRTTIDGNASELWGLVTPSFSMEPFPEAFNALQGTRSLRQVAMRAGMSASSIVRYTDRAKDKRTPDRYDLERIAKALDVHPAHFREWRELVVMEFLTGVLTAKPNLSIALLKAIS
jgi:hypothetical protein